jgi:hypothetical protein
LLYPLSYRGSEGAARGTGGRIKLNGSYRRGPRAGLARATGRGRPS